jgi:parallel beta-helix repeat protein
MYGGWQVRTHLAAAAAWAAVISAALASCSSPAGTAAGPSGQPGVVSASCADAPSDAATLQHAIDSSAPGELVEINAGTCLLTSGITLLSDRTYAGGNTTGTVLKQGAGLAYVLASEAYAGNSATTGEPLSIRDITVECNGSGSTDGLIVLNWHASVEGVDVNGCGGSGIVDTNTTAAGRTITNTSVNSRFDNNFISNSGRYGFEVRDTGNPVTDGFLDDNQIASSGRDAIYLANAAGWDISGNHVYGDGQDGIYANRLYGTTISNNYIEDFGGRQRSGTWYGIRGTAQGGVGSTIFNNKVFNDKGETPGARYVYVAITNTNYGTGYLSVTGNVIVGVKPSDVGFSFAGGAHTLVVASAGNEVGQVGTARQVTGSVRLAAGT